MKASLGPPRSLHARLAHAYPSSLILSNTGPRSRSAVPRAESSDAPKLVTGEADAEVDEAMKQNATLQEEYDALDRRMMRAEEVRLLEGEITLMGEGCGS